MRYLLLFALLFQISGLGAQTFSSTVNQIIPDDGSTVLFEIAVSGLPPAIDTFFGLEKVCLNLDHPYVEDMTVRLEGPNGQTVLLFGGVGGGGDNFEQTCIAGEGLSFSEHGAPFTGIFQSYGVLGNFNRGMNPNGIWKLVMYDTYPGADQGFFIDWQITFGNQPAQPFIYQSSNLPIVKLTTLDQPIVNDPKVPVLMQIIDNGPGQRNFADQNDYRYEGIIMAEWQGFTGPYYPKKNYDFELIDASGNALDTSILDMPRESDWIIKAEYLDRTLIKNSITYEMARRMGRYAPRTKPCELVLDGEYVGVYVLTEKVKRSKDRVDIARLSASDTTGSDLTGGYIFEMNINGEPADWISAYLPINTSTSPHFVEFKYVYPKGDRIAPQQAAYLQQYTAGFEDVLKGADFTDPETGYRKWIDVETFIDFLIVNEFSVNYDSYGRSTYLYKEKDSDGGLLKIGPPWDYDRALDYYNPGVLNLWVWQRTHDYWPFPFWWSRMWEDVSFRQQLACRWQQLRESTLQTGAFLSLIDSLTHSLDEAQQRNFTIWRDLGAMSYPAHVESLKNFLIQRLQWMDMTLAVEQPSAAFSATPLGANAGLWSFAAFDTSAGHYHWDFGDGASSALSNPVHQYTQGGTYTVRLTVEYGQGCSSSSQTELNFEFSTATVSPTTPTFSVAPNPFSSRIVLQPAMPEVFCMLSNAVGQVVYAGTNISQADFSGLPPGVYGLKILDKTPQTLRVVKQ